MKPRLLWAELEKYGYVFTWKKSLCTYALVVVSTVLLGCFFHLRGMYLLCLCIGVVAMVPLFLHNYYRHRYAQQHFLEANTYIEQFLYSFQKSGKVLTTLEDVARLFADGEMQSVLNDAISYMKHTYGKNNVSQEALEQIERVYQHNQIVSMHRFALQVEKNGGEYGQAIVLMLDARRMWADRVYAFLKEKSRRRVQILVSIGASLLLCSVLLFVSKNLSIDIMEYRMTRITTLFVLLLDLLIFYRADCKLTRDLLEDGNVQQDLSKQQEKVKRCQESGKKEWGYRLAKRKVERGLQVVFPQWLMDVSLLLQSENVQVAIMKSYEDAPSLLKPEIQKLVEALRLHPTELEPYLCFLQEYHLPEVSSAMKMLYSISEGTGGSISSQIPDMIRRNQVLLHQADKIKQEDSLAGMYALFLAPQLTGAVKLLADMLVIFYGLAKVGMLQI